MIGNRKIKWIIILLNTVLVITWGSAFGKYHKPLSFKINYVYRSGGQGELRPINDGSVLYTGDHYKIIITPNQDCYIYIFQVDSSGQVFQLFPMDAFKGVQISSANPVKAGKKYILPSADKAFVLDNKTGTEKFYFIGSITENNQAADIWDDISEINYSAEGSIDKSRRKKSNESVKHSNETPQEKLDRYFTQRGIVVIDGPDEVKVKWENKQDIFTIVEKRLVNFCDGCMQILHFIHK